MIYGVDTNIVKILTPQSVQSIKDILLEINKKLNPFYKIAETINEMQEKTNTFKKEHPNEEVEKSEKFQLFQESLLYNIDIKKIKKIKIEINSITDQQFKLITIQKLIKIILEARLPIYIDEEIYKISQLMPCSISNQKLDTPKV
jgi:hypothetical protein